MRLVFGMAGFLVVLAVVSVLTKKQLGAKATPQSTSLANPTVAASGSKNLQLQSQRVQQQLKQSAETAQQREKTADIQ